MRLILRHKHVLNMLLRLEFAALGMVLWLRLLVMRDLTRGRSMIYFYSFVACEGALGLGVLINLVRCHGTDYFLSINLIQC